MSDATPTLHPRDVQRVVENYRERIAQFGPTFESMKSGSVEKQRIRHAIHATALSGDSPSVLDIGCGLGDFYQFLKGAGRACRYTGVDIVPEYIEECRKKFPEARFLLCNVITEGIGETYDSIVLSQALNHRYHDSDNMEVLKTALRLAFAHTRISVSFDLLSSYVDFHEAYLFNYSPEEVFRFAKTLTRRVALRHDYRPFEFAIQLFHEAAPGYVG